MTQSSNNIDSAGCDDALFSNTIQSSKIHRITDSDSTQLLCELFYYSQDKIYTESMFERMWLCDRNEFIHITFYLRGHKYHQVYDGVTVRKIIGRGERKIFHQIIRWMSYNKLEFLLPLLPHIPDHGYWKDLLVLMGTPAETHVIELFAYQLVRDHTSFHSQIPGLISMAAKWTPNEGSSFDSKYSTYGKIAGKMKVSRKKLRTEYLVPLRRYLLVTEQIVSDKKWSSINYNMVPHLSLQRHGKTFNLHDHHRYTDHINKSHIDYAKRLPLPSSVESELSVIHPSQSASLQPDLNLIVIPDTSCIESTPTHFTKLNPEKLVLSQNSVVRAIDVSGSMSGLPITLAACMCDNGGDSLWIPFRFSDNVETNNLSITSQRTLNPPPSNVGIRKIMSMNSGERIQTIKSVCEEQVEGYDLDSCINMAKELGVQHLIIITNTLLDQSEIPCIRNNTPEDNKLDTDDLHVTYWSINMNPVVVEDYNKFTVIEGYDINVYEELLAGRLLTRDRYKQIIMEVVRNVNILPI